jgi:spermidine/putrescine transport system permease protein
MKAATSQRVSLIWTVLIVAMLFMPILSVILASLANTRYFRFPSPNWGLGAYHDVLGQFQTYDLHLTSFLIAALVALLSTLIAAAGALAFARVEWRGRGLFQKLILLPVFFPQAVLGLALLVFFSSIGISPSWKLTVFAHLVLIAPMVTLLVSITLFGFDPLQEEAALDLGASRRQAFWHVTLPVMMPGLMSGALFAFLLSWSNLPLSIYTSGSDTTLPEWLYSRTATNYSPAIPAISVLSMGVTLVIAAVALAGLRLFRKRA